MTRVALLALAAGCWSSSSSPPTPASPASQSPASPSPSPSAAPARPVVQSPPYVLPERVAAALAHESIAGNVLVPHGAALHASIAGARDDAKANPLGVPFALRVIKDHGDVVEVSTGPLADCAGAFDKPYELTVFIRRDHLLPRATAEVTKTFSDGTAVAIDRGAPIAITAQGLAWQDLALAESSTRPREDQIGYAVPASSPAAKLPPSGGERMVCDQGGPQSVDEWRAQRKAERERELEREREERRLAAERRRIEMEREAERRAEQRKAEKAKSKGKSKSGRGLGDTLGDDAARFAELLVGDDPRVGTSNGPGLGDMSSIGNGSSRADLSWRLDDERYRPWCSVSDPSYGYNAVKAAAPTINGVAVRWPSSDSEQVWRVGRSYVADAEYQCGRVRMTIDAAGASRGGRAGVGGGGQVKVWIPAPGKVTWRDGTPAGKYTGTKRYQSVVEENGKVCVAVNGIADMVCHDAKTTKTDMAYRHGLD